MNLDAPLTIDEIEFRVQSINGGGYATILPYKDARADMKRLDSVYGVGFWQRKHEIIGGNLFCSVGVYNKEIGQWVWVQDVGTESNVDKEKGQASDSFKRACFNLGIGRELYAYPVISVKLNQDEYTIFDDRGKKKGRATWKLQLQHWGWESEFTDGKLSYIAAWENQKWRFQWGKKKDV